MSEYLYGWLFVALKEICMLQDIHLTLGLLAVQVE